MRVVCPLILDMSTLHLFYAKFPWLIFNEDVSNDVALELECSITTSGQKLDNLLLCLCIVFHYHRIIA
jgi:hypothetical protein